MTHHDPEPPVPPRADRGRTAPACPFCDSAAVELVSPWGGQIITAQWRCRACGSYFEAVREDFEDRQGETT